MQEGNGHINRGQKAGTDVRAKTVAAKRNTIKNPKWNPINIPKWAARRAAKRQAEVDEYFQSLAQQYGGEWPYQCILSVAARRDLWDVIFNDTTRFNPSADVRLHKSLKELFQTSVM